MNPSDEALVQACRAGDASAWEALIARYQRLIYTIPRRAGLDEDSAGEVFQRVFAKLLERLDSIEEPGRVQAWLVTTARRETWRVRQRQLAAHSIPLDEFEDESLELPDEAPLPEQVLLRLEEQHAVRTALAALEEGCRALLTMLFYSNESPSYEQIGAALGIPEGSVGPTRARCLQKLRRLLARAGF